MTYSLEDGYRSRTFDEVLDSLRQKVNTETENSYTEITFQASNWYRLAYICAQEILDSEQTAEAGWDNIRQYIQELNIKIASPITFLTTLIQKAKEELDIIMKIQQPTDATAGQLRIALNISAEQMQARKQELGDFFVKYGILNFYFSGANSFYYSLPNGQVWRFAFDTLTDTPLKIKLTLRRSRNYAVDPMTEDEIKELFLKLLNERKDAEGGDIVWERIATVSDFGQWVSQLRVEWCLQSDVPPVYKNLPYYINYNETISVTNEDITVTILDA